MNVAMNLNKRFKSTAAMAMIICIMAVLLTGCSRYEVKTPVYPLLDYTMTEQDLADYQSFAEQSENYMFSDDYNEKQATEFIDSLWDDYVKMTYQASIAEILLSCDLKDRQAEKRYM